MNNSKAILFVSVFLLTTLVCFAQTGGAGAPRGHCQSGKRHLYSRSHHPPFCSALSMRFSKPSEP